MAIFYVTSEIERLLYWGARSLWTRLSSSAVLRNKESVLCVVSVLGGGGAECHRHFPEVGYKGKGGGQMQYHAARRDGHSGAKFQQPFAERPYLGASTVGAGGSQAQLLHQHIGRGGQQHAELVGPEAAATGAADM